MRGSHHHHHHGMASMEAPAAAEISGHTVSYTHLRAHET